MGTSNSASNAATQANTDRQNQINQSIQQITQAYGSPQRSAQVDQYGQQVGNYLSGQVNTQEATNARNLKFAMARSGLSGGSAAVDSNTQLQKDYANGLLQASQGAQQAKAGLQQSDISSKNQLIGLAQQGSYIGAIPSQIASAQSASLGAAQTYANPSALGNLFAGTSSIYNNEQTAAANRKAQTSPIGSLYG